MVTSGVPLSRASLDLAGTSLDVAAVLNKVKPSVVSIETSVQVQDGPWVSRGRGAGTGIVIDDKGTIVTNAHVVEGATSVTVTLDGQAQARSAHILAADTANDLAVIRVDDPSGTVPATLGSSAALQVGDDVVAIGNALALEGGLSVTKGIVSALDRSLRTDTADLTGMIQTDAAISSGNSGGALVNARGEVVGINTAVAASGGNVQASNIGFAISIDRARQVIAAMLAS